MVKSSQGRRGETTSRCKSASREARKLWRRVVNRLMKLKLEWVLALALVLSGALNIDNGLRYDLVPFSHIGPLSSMARSLSVLGSTTQVFLGACLVLIGVGLLRRLATAWAFAVLLLAVTVGVNLAQGSRGASLVLPALMLLALLVLRGQFTRRTAMSNYVFSVMSILAVLAYGSFGTYMLGDGFRPPIHKLTTSLYFTVITLATVGYGDIVPVTQETRLFVVSLLVVGLGVFATVIASLLGPALSKEIDRFFNPREEKMKPKDHIILAGEGALAANTSKELQARGIPFVRILAPGTAAPALPESQITRGQPWDDQVLQQAGIDAASLVIAAREDDGENAFISLVAKDLNPSVRVLAVATTAGSIRRLRLARAEIVFAPSVVGGRLLANLVEGKDIPQEFMDLLEGKHRKT
jgi:voltage-gated potassium channel